MGNWGSKFWPSGLFGRFARGERGNVAIIAALAIIPIITVAGFALDFQMTVTKKTKVQYAVDGAVLSAVKSLEQNRPREEVTVEANTYFREILGIANDTFLDCGPLNLVFGEDNEELDASVYCTNDTTLSKIAGKQYLEFTVSSAATYGQGSLEVSLVLDVTGSMSGSRITALKEASHDFIDIVIQDVQVPFYSKAAIVPYSVAVNAGPYANQLRGNVVPGRSITNAVWQDGAQKSISGISKANPGVVTSNNHGFQNGDRIYITGVNGMTQANNRVYTVANRTANTFELQGRRTTSWSTYTNGGIIRKCLNFDCEVTVTANNHGLDNGDHVVIRNVNGMTDINTGSNATWVVANRTANTFVLSGSNGPSYNAYTNGGTAYCAEYGCQFFRFLNRSSNAQRVHEVSTCVTERTGADAWTDKSPSSAPVGFNYPSTSNPCPGSDNVILPLTSNKTALHDHIDDMEITGSTAGHMGAAWGWYMLSPQFGYLFPESSRPGAYNTRSLFKISVFMTDGDFNTAYCNGVIANDSTSGSGSSNDHINCSATNGTSYQQARAYCQAMKDNGIIIYTIGFEVGSITAAQNLLRDCATSPSHAYFASGSDELREVFRAIARSINEVRLTR